MTEEKVSLCPACGQPSFAGHLSTCTIANPEMAGRSGEKPNSPAAAPEFDLQKHLQTLLKKYGRIAEIPDAELEPYGYRKKVNQKSAQVVKIDESEIRQVNPRKTGPANQTKRTARRNSGTETGSAEKSADSIDKVLEVFRDFTVDIEEGQHKSTIKFSENDLEKLRSRLKKSNLLGFSSKTIHEYLSRSFLKTAATLEIPMRSWIEIITEQPGLIATQPEVLAQSIKKIAEDAGVSQEELLKYGKRDPMLLASKPESIKRNLDVGSNLLSVDKAEYVNAAKRNVALWTANPRIVKRKDDIYRKYFLENDTLKKNPGMYNFSPERILAYYAIERVIRKKPDQQLIPTDNPLDYAKKKLRPFEFSAIESAYNYLSKLWQNKREQRRDLGTDPELEAYQTMCDFIEEYFGLPGEAVDLDKIKRMMEKINLHQTKKQKLKETT